MRLAAPSVLPPARGRGALGDPPLDPSGFGCAGGEGPVYSTLPMGLLGTPIPYRVPLCYSYIMGPGYPHWVLSEVMGFFDARDVYIIRMEVGFTRGTR